MTDSGEQPQRLTVATVDTPIGPIRLIIDERSTLRALAFADSDGEATMHRQVRRHYGATLLEPGAAPVPLREQLADYFSGDLDALGRIVWATGGTPFQRAVWTALTAVPPGTTMTYGAFAARLGVPQAVRAVGHANGANPISLVIPCHRLVGSDGTLTGYGGGLERKRWLLAHEGALVEATDVGRVLP